MLAGGTGTDVVDVDVTFRALDLGDDLETWLPGMFSSAWPAYRGWFLRDGEHRRASYGACLAGLRRHMPELLPTYERIVDAVGGGDLEARFLSHWSPPPLFAACSLATFVRDGAWLVRNYDYPPSMCDATVMATQWNGTRVLAMSDCLWGALDGVNEHGLAVAIAFGGRRVVGEGFGIGLVVRYLLDFTSHVPEALAALERLPVTMAYNVALVDAAGRSAIAHLSPDRPMWLSPGASAANRQGPTEWPEHAEFCGTVEREAALARAMDDPGLTASGLVATFLAEPVYRPTERSPWGTVYTAAYDCARGTLDLVWPDGSWRLDLAEPTRGSRTRRTRVALPPPGFAPPPGIGSSRPPLIA